MDKRTDFRAGTEPPRTGHAWYADEARQALGVSHDLLALPGRVPAPIFHAGVGMVVAGSALLARPQRVGYAGGIALDLLLAAVAAIALGYHARLVTPPESRPGAAAGILPAAALLSLALLLGGTGDAALSGVAVVVAATVIAGAPHLEALDAVDRQGPRLRLLRELAGFAVVLPVCVAGASASLSAPVRFAIVLVGAGAVVADTMRVERHPWRAVITGSISAGLATAAGSLVALGRGQAPGAVGLLLVWYGARGLVAHVGRGRGALQLIEHGAFVAVGGAVLGLMR